MKRQLIMCSLKVGPLLLDLMPENRAYNITLSKVWIKLVCMPFIPRL